MNRKKLTHVGIGLLSLLLPFGIGLYGLHRFGVINIWQLPLRPILAFWIGGGVACLLIGWVKPAWANLNPIRFETWRRGERPLAPRRKNHGSRWGRRLKRWWVRGLVIGVIGLNAIAFTSAYGMTHFCSPGQICVGLPRPGGDQTPADIGLTYTTQRLDLNDSEWLETWLIPSAQPSNGTVLLFPGNGGSKATQLLAPAQAFHNLGYDTLLTDFRGVGGSSGHTTTLGTREAEDVAWVMAQAESLNLKPPLILYGVSMGTAAIMNAIATQSISPDAIILELPFVRLVDSVKSRLRFIRLPTFPLAQLIVFWGSVQHGFNGFAHNPIDYASKITSPTLVFQGAQDRWISVDEVEALVQNMQGPNQLVVFPNAGHNLLVTVDPDFWQQQTQAFLAGAD